MKGEVAVRGGADFRVFILALGSLCSSRQVAYHPQWKVSILPQLISRQVTDGSSMFPAEKTGV